MLLIETRREPPPPGDSERPVWEPNWRLWGWVALMVVVLVGASSTGGILSYLLACAGLGLAGRVPCVLVPYGTGLRDYRQ